MRRFGNAGAAAAVTAGVLRIADSFTAGVLEPNILQALYVVTDGLLLAGAVALWAERRATLGWAGHAGLAIFVIGILTIRLARNYQIGAAVAVLGLALYSVEALIARDGQPAAPIAWLLSLGFGVAGAFGVTPQAMLAAAGVAFGSGFVFAGAGMFAKKKEGRAG